MVDAVNASLAHLGAGPIGPDDYQRSFVRPLNLFYERLLGHPVDDGLLAVIDEVFHDAYWQAYVDADLAFDALTAMTAVGTAAATQSVASMLRHELLVPSVQRFGIDSLMLAVDGHRGRLGETKEQHLIDHVERLESMYDGLSRTRMVAIGDIVDDAAAARSAGIDCVLYDGGGQSRDALEATGFPVVATLVSAVELALARPERPG